LQKYLELKTIKTKSTVKNSAPFSAVQKQFLFSKKGYRVGADTNSLISISDLYVDAVPLRLPL
jgi:hypothetical protein